MHNTSVKAQPPPQHQAGKPAVWGTPAANAARRSVYNPTTSRVPPWHDQVTFQMGHFSLGTAPKLPALGGYNPSEGPGPSVAMHYQMHSRASSQLSTTSPRQMPVKNDIFVLSGLKRRDFRQGEVISLPYHIPNTNPNIEPTDPKLTKTWLGPAYTKRRMMVVLFLYQESMFCLPLYSFSERGLSAKAELVQKEYVCMKNVGDRHFVNSGHYEPVEIRTWLKPMTPETTVQLTGGIRVSFDEEIAPVGRLTEASYEHLVNSWQGLGEQARSQPWRA